MFRVFSLLLLPCSVGVQRRRCEGSLRCIRPPTTANAWERSLRSVRSHFTAMNAAQHRRHTESSIYKATPSRYETCCAGDKLQYCPCISNRSLIGVPLLLRGASIAFHRSSVGLWVCYVQTLKNEKKTIYNNDQH